MIARRLTLLGVYVGASVAGASRPRVAPRTRRDTNNLHTHTYDVNAPIDLYLLGLGRLEYAGRPLRPSRVRLRRVAIRTTDMDANELQASITIVRRQRLIAKEALNTDSHSLILTIFFLHHSEKMG